VITGLRIFWYVPKTVIFYILLVRFNLISYNIFIMIFAVITDILAFVSGYL